ncbi:glycoside hydrolase family 108 protein [Insolitispirillum peregrinum]|uniref:Predicted Peptidoglycan domain-containing protein n=1 Tax=Insolitispirillum peregrinum TaxID=80876 RepID=A0A1N7LS44_9PROT|nr:glycosyl hydrolase 108 family protein [Insolitispirillum peregrinum]SIS76670.1 Predicted Peptidoglycan domain-containing protein [Insolitispirillum peregrinum]
MSKTTKAPTTPGEQTPATPATGAVESHVEGSAAPDTPDTTSDSTPPQNGQEQGSAFDHALAFVLSEEGGYVNDPRDGGGETNFGISRRAYPGVDIAGLTRDQAAEIYRRDYWDACKCDQMPAPWAVAVFDTAVNQGSGAAAFLLQTALGLKADTIIGPKTLAAVTAAGPDKLNRYLAWRIKRYTGTANFDRYGVGWIGRVLRLQALLTSGLR